MSKYPCKDCIILLTCIEPCDKADKAPRSTTCCNYCGGEIQPEPPGIAFPVCVRCNNTAKYYSEMFGHRFVRKINKINSKE